MADYIDRLLDDLEANLPSLSRRDPEYQSRSAEARAAMDTLCETLSPQQRKLFLFYEDARNALDEIEQRSFARRAFLLARDIFR